MMRSYLILFVFLIPVLTFGQEANKKWTVDHIINTEYPGSVKFSPDGNGLVWSKRRGLTEKDKFISDIYLTRLDLEKGGMPRTFRLTNADENDYAPIFSRDGEDIYFLSAREKGKKLWKISTYGGEPQEVYTFNNGISRIAWKDAHTLLFTAHDGKTLRDEENKKDNTLLVDDSLHLKITRIYAYDLNDKSITRITNNTHPISSYSVSKNGNYLVYQLRMSMQYGYDGQAKPKTYLQNLTTGEVKQIVQAYHETYGFDFTSDNSGFYFSSTKTSSPIWNGPGSNELYYYTIATGQATKVDLQWENGHSGYEVIGNDAIVSLANGPYRSLAFYRKLGTSWRKQELNFGNMDDHVRLLAIAENGKRIAFNYSTASKLPEFIVSDFTVRKKDVQISGSKEFVKLNKGLQNLPITKSEVYKWIGANNEEVNGMLYYPENYESGKKYPLMLSIHGGPTGVDTDTWSERWSTYPQILAQRGAFVLKPNYHGSGNHGQSFVESIGNGVYYDLEEIDMLKAIEDLNNKGLIDMNKLGVMGWSNGAILATMMTLRHPDMFKVCAAGAGDVNWTSDYGTCNFGVTFDQYYFGGAPWDDVNGKTYNETYILKSPLFEIEKIKTPTIIFHGSEDRSVPRDQGWEYYHGLQQVGIAPVRFLWFPGQPHGLQKITHQKRKMKEELIWLDTYLFETYVPKNEAFKEKSPLGKIMKLREYAMQSDGLYGKILNNQLIPQTVSLGEDSIAIGVFEVTNAQIKALLKDYSYPIGKDNYPATGLSKGKIEQYLNALNTTTGKIYRLPNSEEAKVLHKKAGKVAAEENTLRYWAGYELTLSDAAKLSAKINEDNPDLFMEVGHFKPVQIKKAKLYDLGGNAAEYYLDGSEMKVYGYSAYDFYDETAAEATAMPKHSGFRVVLTK